MTLDERELLVQKRKKELKRQQLEARELEVEHAFMHLNNLNYNQRLLLVRQSHK